ncbi:ABC transporter permease [Nocardiopsis coralliicola]
MRLPRRPWGGLGVAAVAVWMCAPAAFMAVFGFNDAAGRYNVTWQGFTLRWYRDAFAHADLNRALLTSLAIALLTMAVAGMLGALLGLALGRHRFRGRAATEAALFASIAAPEVVLGAGLLSLFLALNIATGFWTTVIAHVAFALPFAALTVRARVRTLDPALEEAARDLGATPAAAFRLVTLPLLAPGIAAGGLVAFVLSLDDYIVTSFVSGTTTTFPQWIWGSTRVGIPPQVNVVGTLLLAAGLALAAGSALRRRRR